MSALRSRTQAASGLILLAWMSLLYPLAFVRAGEDAGQGEFANPDAHIEDAAKPVNTSNAREENRAVLVADPPESKDKGKEAKAGNGNVASAGTGYHLTLDEAIELAIQRNLNLLESRISDRVSDIGVRETWAQYFPTFNAGISHGNSFSTGQKTGEGLTTVTGGLTQQTIWGTQLGFALSDTYSTTTGLNSGSAAFNLRQPLWKGAGTDVGLAAIRTARIGRLISRDSLELAVQRLIFTVRNDYANIVRAIQNLEVDRQGVRSDRSFLDLTNARYKAGQVTQLEVFNAEVQFHADELTVVNDEAALEFAFDQLKELLDVDLHETLRVDAPVVDFGENQEPGVEKAIISDEPAGTVYLKVTKDGQPVGAQPLLFRATHFDESVILQEALSNRLDLLNARRTLAIEKVQSLLSKDGLGHQIDLLGSLGRTTSGRAIVEADNSRENNSWSTGLSATFPWGKIRDRAAYERALLTLEKAEIDLKLARTAVEADVRNTLRTLLTGEKGLLIGGQQVEQAKRAEMAAKVSFDRGLKDSFNVIQAEQALLAAKRNFVNSALSYTVQLAQLELSVGKPTGRVNLKGDSVGGLVESKLPESLRNRELPKPAPNADPRPEDDPFSKTPEYRKDYKADKDKILIDKPAD